ncbi:peptide chain release factor 1 [Candidatus Woesearchaeota archaeon]|nr:peptide chain release factor 1 [Candidatus Woesearchaeota archaeon]
MSLNVQDKLHLKRLITELKAQKALHTEFVSVYIPAEYDIIKIIQHLAEEQGTASNIKSAITRKNVQSALEKMIQHLRLFPKTPPNGLAVFTGNVAATEGKQDMRVWSIEPPVPLNVRLYRCDKNFIVDILEDMLAEKEVYGLVVLDHRDATLALLRGKSIITLAKTHSEVPGKMRAGGQSAPRFARARELANKMHYKKIADYMIEQFLPLGNNLKGIIIGGPGVTVNDFMNHDYVTGELKKKIIGTKDLSYTDDFGLQELLDKSTDLLEAEEVAREKKIMVDTLLLSENLPEDRIFKLEEQAAKGGTEVKIISIETREGVQLKEMGGIAAILRFEIG